MNIESKFTWERSAGEEIELTIGGEYQPAEQPTEYDRFQPDMASLDFAETADGIRLDWFNFSPAELEAMEQKLLEAAREKYAQRNRSQFPGLRSLMGLGKPEKGFVE